jgi:hypothetical protein
VMESSGRVRRYERMSDSSVLSELRGSNMCPSSGSQWLATLSRPGMYLLCRKLRTFCTDTHPSDSGHCVAPLSPPDASSVKSRRCCTPQAAVS